MPGPARRDDSRRGARFVSGVSVEDLASVAEVMESFRPDAVVNCIGIVKQRAEAHESIPSIRANALFPHEVALCARWPAPGSCT